MCGGMYTTIAGGYRRYASPPVLPAAPKKNMHIKPERLRFTMDMIAYHSGEMENAPWDRWELHATALTEAYQLGHEKNTLILYYFLKWHGMILPFGGTLRQSDPVSVGMGESFQPQDFRTLAPRVMRFVCEFNAALAASSDHWLTLARLHFVQWQMHPYPDGNKRHARLMTVYGCGWFGLPAVCITLAEKPQYLDTLRDGDIAALARLLEAHTIGE